jgi:hypothetical protein
LAQLAAITDKVRRRNVGPDYGDWFHPAERLDRHGAVPFWDSWDAGHPAGNPDLTFAMIFDVTNMDEAVAHMLRVTDRIEFGYNTPCRASVWGHSFRGTRRPGWPATTASGDLREGC